MLRPLLISGLLSAFLVIGCHAADSETAEPQPTLVAELPLKRGYYVHVDTPCDEASNATVGLLSRDGFGGCGFSRIEALGGNRYRVHRFCHPREPDEPVEYVVSGDERFHAEGDGAGESGEVAYRHCPQSSMSEWFRDNDISDLTR